MQNKFYKKLLLFSLVVLVATPTTRAEFDEATVTLGMVSAAFGLSFVALKVKTFLNERRKTKEIEERVQNKLIQEKDKLDTAVNAEMQQPEAKNEIKTQLNEALSKNPADTKKVPTFSRFFSKVKKYPSHIRENGALLIQASANKIPSTRKLLGFVALSTGLLAAANHHFNILSFAQDMIAKQIQA